ncbi:putative membrane protein [Mycolicibacterium litorale]|uniref:Putative membrane protein n=1 Tax=Mycolicibacterium litorale TaxID=758802 RepID=A0A6S6PCL8_9MYCO|nr:hypothetical protein [Mycolicibacterium litorale]BCI55842.1 putative membrane protein [Mycolicibacterium litorale]
MSLFVRLRCTLRRLAGGPLVRFVDRVEASATLMAAVLLVVAGFVAVHISTAVRDDQLRAAEIEAANRHAVEAVALDRSKAKPQRSMTTFTVQVQWFANGVTRDTIVEVPHAVKQGDRVGIWIDTQGNVASAPLSADDARARGVGAGIGMWLASLSVVTAALLVLRRALNRARYRAWDRDLVLLVGGGGSAAHSP